MMALISCHPVRLPAVKTTQPMIASQDEDGAGRTKGRTSDRNIYLSFSLYHLTKLAAFDFLHSLIINMIKLERDMKANENGDN